MLLSAAGSGAKQVCYVYWQQKLLDQRMGRCVRVDGDGRLIYATTQKIVSWAHAEVIIPGAWCTVTKSKKEGRTVPPKWIAKLIKMCEVALGNSIGGADVDAGHHIHDAFSLCQACYRDLADPVFTCCLCLRSLHQACCAQLLDRFSDELLKLTSPLAELSSLPSPLADNIDTPECALLAVLAVLTI